MMEPELLALISSDTLQNDTEIFAVTMQDINKALEVKLDQRLDEIEKKLSPKSRTGLVSLDEGSTLPPHRVSDIKINLQKDDKSRDKPIPWGSLYSMSRDELLVLRKMLSDHLDEGWIRASGLPGGAAVFFVKKPGGGLRFCVDYRALNLITKKDRYPLPFIKEMLRSISKSTWITKVDIRAAFHKLKVREEDEEKTAFRTRFGSFEWLVTPFGLQGAPAAFQRHVNETLEDNLDVYCTAYLDDILIYTKESLEDHWDRFKQFLNASALLVLNWTLKSANLQLKAPNTSVLSSVLGNGSKWILKKLRP
ncbi:hypothetical protein K3495_g3467 [Podosphaera aphanis]|nr:hypothetical protein K3495_g3467 [Podosphaera aphanis]